MPETISAAGQASNAMRIRVGRLVGPLILAAIGLFHVLFMSQLAFLLLQDRQAPLEAWWVRYFFATTIVFQVFLANLVLFLGRREWFSSRRSAGR